MCCSGGQDEKVAARLPIPPALRHPRRVRSGLDLRARGSTVCSVVDIQPGNRVYFLTAKANAGPGRRRFEEGVGYDKGSWRPLDPAQVGSYVGR